MEEISVLVELVGVPMETMQRKIKYSNIRVVSHTDNVQWSKGTFTINCEWFSEEEIFRSGTTQNESSVQILWDRKFYTQGKQEQMTGGETSRAAMGDWRNCWQWKSVHE